MTVKWSNKPDIAAALGSGKNKGAGAGFFTIPLSGQRPVSDLANGIRLSQAIEATRVWSRESLPARITAEAAPLLHRPRSHDAGGAPRMRERRLAVGRPPCALSCAGLGSRRCRTPSDPASPSGLPPGALAALSSKPFSAE